MNNFVNNTIESSKAAYDKALTFGNDLAEKSEFLNKSVGLLSTIIKLAKKISDYYHFSLSSSVITLGGRAGRAKDILDLFSLPKVVAELLTPERDKNTNKPLVDKNDGGYVFFLTNAQRSIEKKVERVFLLAHASLKTLRILDKLSVIDISRFSKWTLDNAGNLSVLEAVTNGFMVISGTFSMLDTRKELAKSKAEINTETAKTDKWLTRGSLIGRLKANSVTEDQITDLVTKYGKKQRDASRGILATYDKRDVIEQKLRNIDTLPEAERPAARAKLESQLASLDAEKARCEEKQGKYGARLEDIRNRNFEALAGKLENQDIVFKIQKHKIDRLKAEEKQTISRVKMVSTAAKVALIALSLAFTFFNTWMIIPTVTVLALGVISDSTALYRMFLEEHKAEFKYPARRLQVA